MIRLVAYHKDSQALRIIIIPGIPNSQKEPTE